MRPVTAEFKYYNANTRNVDVGDCVKRGLSLAFGMDYDETGKELNRIKRALGASAYNSDRVLFRFMKEHNRSFIRMPDPKPTVQEFCEMHSSGTWVCLTGRHTRDVEGTGSHLLCIIDGDVYDSWNSLNDKVVEYCCINQGHTEFEALDPYTIFQTVSAEVNDYCSQLALKNQKYLSNIYCKVFSSNNQMFLEENNTTGKIQVRVAVGQSFRWSAYKSGETYAHNIIMKLNIRATNSENIMSLTKKTKQKIYDWVYNLVKDIKDAELISRQTFNEAYERNKNEYWGNYESMKIIVQLPEWVRPLVTYATYDKWDKQYRVTIQRLDNDPEKGHGWRDTKTFYEDTLRELKDAIGTYLWEVENGEEQ